MSKDLIIDMVKVGDQFFSLQHMSEDQLVDLYLECKRKVHDGRMSIEVLRDLQKRFNLGEEIGRRKQELKDNSGYSQELFAKWKKEVGINSD